MSRRSQRGLPVKEAEYDVSHEASERLSENTNTGKWLDSLRVSALTDVKAIVKENSNAYTARINATLSEKQPAFQQGALDDVAHGREELVRLEKLLEGAELMVKDVADFQKAKDVEGRFSSEASAWLKAERDRAREASGEVTTRSNAHVEKGVLQFAKRCS